MPDLELRGLLEKHASEVAKIGGALVDGQKESVIAGLVGLFISVVSGISGLGTLAEKGIAKAFANSANASLDLEVTKWQATQDRSSFQEELVDRLEALLGQTLLQIVRSQQNNNEALQAVLGAVRGDLSSFRASVLQGLDEAHIRTIRQEATEGAVGIRVSDSSRVRFLVPTQAKGIDPLASPRDLLDPYLSKLVDEYENWGRFNMVDSDGSPGRTTPMMIPKMGSTDLYKHYVPVHARLWPATIARRARQEQFWAALGLAEQSKGTLSIDTALTRWALVPGPRNASPLILLLGDYGTGKSSAALHFVFTLAKRLLTPERPEGPAPLYFNLSTFRDHATIEEYLEERLAAYGIVMAPGQAGRLVGSTDVLLVFDGFDEMVSRVNLDETRRLFRVLTGYAAAGLRTVVSARTHYFASNAEARTVATGATDSANPLLRVLDPGLHVEVLELEEFSDEDVRSAITKRVPEAEVSQLIATIDATYNLRDLSHRPVLLDMIVTTWPMLATHTERIGIATIYHAYTSIWIKRDDWRSNLTVEGREHLALLLAWNLLAEGPQSLSLRAIATMLPADVSKWLRPKHLRDASTPEERISYDLGTCSFLRRDEGGQYSFSHRSFLEYFAAVHLLARLEAGNYEILGKPMASYGTAVRLTWPSPEVALFLQDIIRDRKVVLPLSVEQQRAPTATEEML